MTIHSMGGREFTVLCNGQECDESRIVDGALREDVISQLRDDGWRCDNDTPGSVWQHICPECLTKAWRERYGFREGETEAAITNRKDEDDGAD